MRHFPPSPTLPNGPPRDAQLRAASSRSTADIQVLPPVPAPPRPPTGTVSHGRPRTCPADRTPADPASDLSQVHHITSLWPDTAWPPATSARA